MSNKELESYIFYCYHRAYLDEIDYNSNETSNSNVKKNSTQDLDISFYSRQKFIANIYPKTRKKYDNQDSIYKLANLCLWDDDEDIDLDDDENIEDASDDVYVCFNENGKEVSAKEYLISKNINLNFVDEGCTEFASWHDDKINYKN